MDNRWENTPQILTQAAKVIDRQLAVIPASNENEVFSYAELINKYVAYVQALLDNDFEKLLQLIYRIDVSEEKFNQVLVNESSENIATAITKLIVERQLQKVITWQKYANS